MCAYNIPIDYNSLLGMEQARYSYNDYNNHLPGHLPGLAEPEYLPSRPWSQRTSIHKWDLHLS